MAYHWVYIAVMAVPKGPWSVILLASYHLIVCVTMPINVMHYSLGVFQCQIYGNCTYITMIIIQ